MCTALLRRAAALTGLACLLLLLGAAPALSLPPGWTNLNVSENADMEGLVGIDGSSVVWTSHPVGVSSRDILVYSAATGATRIVIAGATVSDPVLDGRWVAFVQGSGQDAEIWVWDGSTGSRRRITSNSASDSSPALSGDILVWTRNDDAASEIYWTDLSDERGEQRLTNNLVKDHQPVVDGEWVAWRQKDPAGAFQEHAFIQLYNVRTAARTLVTPRSDPVSGLCLDGGLLAYSTQPDCENPAHDPFQVMVYNTATRTVRAVTEGQYSSSGVAMASGRIAYITREPSRNALYLYDVESRTYTDLAFWPYAVSSAIGPNWIVWQAGDVISSEILAYHFATKSFVQLTDNAIDDVSPLISDERVAWTRSDDWTHNDVWLASFALPFTDVSRGYVYGNAIQNLFILEIMSGYSPTIFGVNDSLLRQQFAKMIVLTTGVRCTEADRCRFADVNVSGPSDLYPDNYVEAAAREGLTTGKTPTLFAPYDPISRAQVMTMVVRAGGRFVSGGLQAPPASWHGHLADFSDPTHGQNARVAEYNGLLAGIELQGWDVWADSSRGEVAQMLWNLWTMMDE